MAIKLSEKQVNLLHTRSGYKDIREVLKDKFEVNFLENDHLTEFHLTESVDRKFLII